MKKRSFEYDLGDVTAVLEKILERVEEIAAIVKEVRSSDDDEEEE